MADELDNLRQSAQWAMAAKAGDMLAELATTPRNWLYNVFRINEEWLVWLTSALALGIEVKGLKANVLKAIGDVQQFRKQSDAALQSYQQALALFKEIGDRLGEANVLQSKGKLFVVTGKGDEGLKLLQESLSLYEAIGDMTSGVNIYFFLAQVMASSGRYKEAIPLAEKVIAIIERVDSSHPALQTVRDFLQQLQQQANAG
ncbi:MAG TPA: tetratricopeptide repeat protein [Anaerolineales bacterium]|nr:tetratricopeptide repeat protein [Anaerolineales bacterium]